MTGQGQPGKIKSQYNKSHCCVSPLLQFSLTRLFCVWTDQCDHAGHTGQSVQEYRATFTAYTVNLSFPLRVHKHDIGLLPNFEFQVFWNLEGMQTCMHMFETNILFWFGSRISCRKDLLFNQKYACLLDYQVAADRENGYFCHPSPSF